MMCKSCGQPIKKGRELAGFWRRYGALALDYAILYALLIITMIITAIVASLVSLAVSSVGLGNDHEKSLVFIGGIVALILYALVMLLYFAWFESSRYQATPGKMAVGMAVVDLEGRRISFQQAIVRTLAKVISAAILGIGFLIIGFTIKRQGLHDMIAGTTVVMRNTVYLDLPEAPK
jgi:uncharacterized RDD family membrane protein YckC